jgi:hypothetical protein
MATMTDHEAQQIDKANQVNGKSPDRGPLLAFVKRFV